MTTFAPVCLCGHAAAVHEVDDEELRECHACSCKQYVDLEKLKLNDAQRLAEYQRYVARTKERR